MEFTKQELNKKFKINTSKNVLVRLPNGKEKLLSEIEDEATLSAMMARKSNLISEKIVEPKPQSGTSASATKP